MVLDSIVIVVDVSVDGVVDNSGSHGGNGGGCSSSGCGSIVVAALVVGGPVLRVVILSLLCTRKSYNDISFRVAYNHNYPLKFTHLTQAASNFWYVI